MLPLTSVQCCHRDGRRGTRVPRLRDHRRREPPQARLIHGSFPPPPRTLQLGVGRQPDGVTCGTQTFLGICELLRMPLHEPDDVTLRYVRELVDTTRDGTDPEHLVHAAVHYLHAAAEARSLDVPELARLVDDTQPYIESLNGGGPIDRDLRLAMVSYQAYVDGDHERSRQPDGSMKSIRRAKDWSVIWDKDWSDGHWSAVARVVLPGDKHELAAIRGALGPGPRVDEVRRGVVVLADPSNGEGLSFVPCPEFEKRWHDTDRRGKDLGRWPGVVFTIPQDRLREMRKAAVRRGVAMFSTVARNAVLYVP